MDTAARRRWMAFVAMLLLWMATIEQQPGGIEALVARMEAVEERVGQNLARAERPLVVRRDGSTVTEYTSGVLCEGDGEQLTDCHLLLDPSISAY